MKKRLFCSNTLQGLRGEFPGGLGWGCRVADFMTPLLTTLLWLPPARGAKSGGPRQCWGLHAPLPPLLWPLCALAFVSVLPVTSIWPCRPAPCSDCSVLDAFPETASEPATGLGLLCMLPQHRAALLGSLSLLAVCHRFLASLVAQWERTRLPMQETWVWPLGQEDPLEKEWQQSSITAGQVPWTEEPGGLQSTGSFGVGQDSH